MVNSSKNTCYCSSSAAVVHSADLFPAKEQMSKGAETKTDKMEIGNRHRKGEESSGQMGKLATTWHTFHRSVCDSQ